MKQILFYALCWVFSGGPYINTNVDVLVTQTFSKDHAVVTKKGPKRLNDIDVANPLFIFK